jgi:hypothetical protein
MNGVRVRFNLSHPRIERYFVRADKGVLFGKVHNLKCSLMETVFQYSDAFG